TCLLTVSALLWGCHDWDALDDCPGNLIQNGTFDQGISDWAAYNSTLQWLPRGGHSRPGALLACSDPDPTTTDFGIVQPSAGVHRGGRLRAMGWMKLLQGSPADVKLEFEQPCCANVGAPTSVGTEWQQLRTDDSLSVTDGLDIHIVGNEPSGSIQGCMSVEQV